MDIQKVLDNLGLRDYKDEDARQKAIQDKDLTIKMSLVQALIVMSAFDYFRTVLSMPEENIVSYTRNMLALINNVSTREKVIDNMVELSQQSMKEIYRKQREIYAEKNH